MSLINLSISLLALILSAFSLFQTTKINTLRAKLEVFRTYQIRSEKATEWADAFIEVSSFYLHICDYTDDLKKTSFSKKRVESLSALTGLVETGRWYFPNVKYKEIDTDKEYAYKGKMSLIVSEVFSVLEIIGEMTYTKYLKSCGVYKARITTAQRAFVSSFQKWLLVRENNKLREQFFNKLIKQKLPVLN